MAFRETVVRGSAAREHVVQLFDTAESLGQTVARFVQEGLAAEDVVLVVARSASWTTIAERLARDTADIGGALRRGRLIVLDAAATLAKFMKNGRPDDKRFAKVIGGLVHELAARGRLRVYGEMVDVLATDAQFRAAIALEHLWNALGRTVSFSLFCGYSAVNFGSPRSGDALDLICRCHSATRVDDDDDLAAWLLDGQAPGDLRVPS
jgi:hypothetical protein